MQFECYEQTFEDFRKSPTFQSLPQILYKYRDWQNLYNKTLLTNSEVFLASPPNFNDPFDSSIPFRYNPEELTPDAIFAKLFSTGKELFPSLTEEQLVQKCYEQQSSGRFTDNTYWRDHYPAFKAQINSRFGILSLSETPENILMWSHYANCHKGFCVGLDKELLFNSIGGTIGRVIYSETFPFAPLFDPHLGMLSILLMTKSSLWEYEREVRILKIDAADKIIGLPTNCIKEVIVGVNMAQNEKDEIFQLVSGKYKEAKFYECYKSDEKFEVTLLPLIKKSS